jgi:DNA-binding beta-propeller fold protein YncE
VAAGIGGYLLFGGGQKTCPTPVATAFATAKTLPCVHLHWVPIGGKPFDAVAARSFGFVSYSTGLAVMNTASFIPTVKHDISLPAARGEARGEALTPNGQYLLVAGGSGITVFKVSHLEQGDPDPLCPLSSGGPRDAAEVTPSPDGKFAFVTLQHSGQVAVFNLQRAETTGRCFQSDLIQKIQVPPNPVGIAASADGRYLYVATGLGDTVTTASKGYLVILDMRKAETKTRRPILHTVAAGRGLARVVISPDRKYVWATVGGGNTLLAYSAAELIHDSNPAPKASVTVGQAPLGLVFVKNNTRIVVADSNRYDRPGTAPDLAVIDVHKALEREPAVLGIITSKVMPRQFALESNRKTLLVTSFGSKEVGAVNAGQLP